MKKEPHTIKDYILAIKNWLLCKRYPFLYISVDWRGYETEKWPFVKKYSRTFFDDIPEGWRKAFGKQMIKDIRKTLKSHDLLNIYFVSQVKEKFGRLSWYDNIYNEDLSNIKSYYSDLSEKTCIRCGAPAKWITTGWINPYCDQCKNIYLLSQPDKKFTKI